MSTHDTRPGSTGGADVPGPLYGGPDDDWTPEQLSNTLFLESATLDELLVDWLEEVRFVGEFEQVVFARFQVELRPGSPARLAGKAWGEPYDAAKHGHLHEVKAVTRHGLKVETSPPQVEVILDI